MATQATSLRDEPVPRAGPWQWFLDYVRWEVIPYPGRANTVIRMTIAATLVMIVVVTFHISNAFLGSFYALLLARENLAATWRSACVSVLGFTGATLYTLLGTMLFRDYPITHFFWVIASLYLIFFVMRTATNYAAALAFGVPIGIALPVWDGPMTSQAQVEGTLWPLLIIAIGAGVTIATEAIYRVFDRSDPLINSVADMLLAAQQVTESIAAGSAPSETVRSRVHQYHNVGTGRLRVMLQRQGLEPAQRARRSALISLARRLVDLAADLERAAPRPSDEDAARLRALAERIGAIRTELRQSGALSGSPFALARPSLGVPVLQEMEQIVALITEVYQTEAVVDDNQIASAREWWHGLFQPDTFRNRDYQRFAFAGCMAASVCYLIYNAIDWPGISTSLFTCIVTALTTIGSSLQQQFLRLAGFVVGGLILGIAAQILILPAIDSISGFALFFAVATAIGSWFATSSPRLSYFGLQIALSFYFVNLHGYQIETDLTIGRDKVLGVLLGILAMGFIFDRIGPKSDAEQLQSLLVRNVRMLAQLVAPSGAHERGSVTAQTSHLRSQINENFANLEMQMDATRFEFEFRQRGQDDFDDCQRIQKVQPWLRSIYLMDLSLLSHRGRRSVGSELSPEQNEALGPLSE